MAMNTAQTFRKAAAGVTLGLMALLTSCAQGQYGQPNYDPNGGYSQQPGYDPYNQPGYDSYNRDQYNQYGYGQPDFYGQLSPYGQWVNTPEYGRVWMPNVGPDFQPYASNGRWVWTEWGNTWVSDYAWGWAPFHYGRWFRDPYRGWAWVPGREWAPAWVSWRQGGGYYGWAPLGPGINVNINVNIPANHWTFVPQAYISSPRLYSYCVPRPQVVNIYQQTTIINNVYTNRGRGWGNGRGSWAAGPRREEIERVTRQQVPVYRIENNGRPGRDEIRGNSVGIYRPDASRDYNAGRGNNGTGRGNQGGVYNQPFENGNVPDANVPRGNTGGRYGGNYGNTEPQRTTPEAPPTYPQPGGYGTSRGSRGSGSYGGQSQPSPQPQARETAPAPQPSQPAPMPGPREWGGNRRGSGAENAQRQREVNPAERTQMQQLPRGSFDNRGEPGYQSGRGSSRGPRNE
jgi:hypothetical protein